NLEKVLIEKKPIDIDKFE
ncbi:hypothetical protein Goarm_023070, partial [Gossypium armourianum]|nr:hypothetical protein [Gossypium armourianum]